MKRTLMVLFTVVAAALPALLVSGQEKSPETPEGPVWAMYWNVANLFDTQDDPEVEGRDAMDAGEQAEKLRRLRETVRRVNWGRGPDVLLVAEVESAGLIADLAGEGYRVVFDPGEYRRGLNVGMATRLPVQKQEYLDPGTTGRTILHAVLGVGEAKLHVYALHFKSKFNPETETTATRADEELRAKEALFLRGHITELLDEVPDADVLVMGDFNEHYRDSLFRRELLSREFRRGDRLPSQSDDDRRLLNLGAALQQSYPDGGTCYYHPHWSIFDNILVSEALVLPGGLETSAKEAHIGVSWDLLNNYGTPAHFNPKYPTCVSDHLPVLVRIRRGE